MATRNSGSSRCLLHRRALSPSVGLLAAAVALALVSGCASPGEPSERRPPVPEAVSDLTASQFGNSVLLTFAVPQDSVGGAPLEHFPAIQIYRDFEPVASSGEFHPVAPKHPTLLTTIPSDLVSQYTERSQFRYSDHLDSSDFTNHPNSVAVYSMQSLVSANKPSALSNLAVLRIYPAPDPIPDLRCQVTPTAVVLMWTAPRRTPIGPISSVSGYRIYRAEARAQSMQSTPLPASNPVPGGPPSPPALLAPLVKIGKSTSPSFSDSQAEFGKTYVYSVRSVIDYSGVAVESGDSNFLTNTPRDIFPPAAPTGLIGIFAPAESGIPAHIDLSWAVSPEADLAGYRVYRSDQAGVLGAPLGAELLLTPAFRDMNVVSGHRYFYTVTAVDRSGNESQPSATIPVTIPDDPAQP